MQDIFRRKPSASMIVAVAVLVFAASGTAVAAGSLASGDKVIKKNSLSGNRLRNHTVTSLQIDMGSLGKVPSAANADHATTADSATTATNATNATNATTATNATNATSATNANHANSATTATNATNASNAMTANVANTLAKVTYVKGNVVNAPANGGSGYAESDASSATCPAGTVVIGTGSHTGRPGIEVSEQDIFIGAGATAPIEVVGLFDNFNNTAVAPNYVIAVCAAANSVSNP